MGCTYMNKIKVHIETFGCQMNISDTERVSTQLTRAGYELSDSHSDADVILINTCSVRARAEQKVFTRVGEIRSSRGRNPLIGILGCVAQLEGTSIFDHAPSVSLVAGTRAADRVPELIERALDGEKRLVDLGERGEDKGWDVSPVERHSKHVAFIPIIEGCNKFCTYCIVPYSRGRERSRPAGEVIEEIYKLQDLGYKEVHLIGQNVNSYRPKTDLGLDNYKGATPFSRLLRAVASTKMPRIKFTTSFPRDFHRDIVDAIDENENLCNWVHLPVQSGNDRVLKLMRRGYKVSDYVTRIESIKNARRCISLTSDVIVGFPGEMRHEFDDTKALVEQCQYDGLYIFKYSERKGTPASLLSDGVSEKEKSDRFETLEALQKGLQKQIYSDYVGRVLSVLVEGESARSSSDLTGHSTCNKVVNFTGDKELLGRIANIRITEAKANSLYGVSVS